MERKREGEGEGERDYTDSEKACFRVRENSRARASAKDIEQVEEQDNERGKACAGYA